MLRISLSLSVALFIAAPAVAASEKQESCRYQAQVVSAVQQARMDRVPEREVPAAIKKTGPSWPSNYNAAIPLVAPWVYGQPMSVLRQQDLGEVWNEQCLLN